MQPSRHYCLCASLVFVLFALLPPRALADNLTITSDPPGATVEIDGAVVGRTPCKINYPGGYFHKTHTVFSERLEHAMTLRIYKDGYTADEISLTEGPFEWVGLNGRDHGHYWLIKSKQIGASLNRAAAVFSGSIHTSLKAVSNMQPRPELSPEQVAEIATPAVVKLRNSDGWGTGFLITDTGVIATNHHVTEGSRSVDVVFPHGEKLLGKVVYTDSHLDLALVKVEGSGFPYLALADNSQIQRGQTVIAIGNPDKGMTDTVTRGIVSAIGPSPLKEPGTWIQTDASINPGNSGGPLLNSQGEVIGINTAKSFQSTDGRPLEGLGFALSATDLVAVLHRFYPDTARPAPKQASLDTGTVAIMSAAPDAEIYVDGKFVGQTPSTLQLTAGTHHVEVKSPDQQPWVRDLEVTGGSELTLRAASNASP